MRHHTNQRKRLLALSLALLAIMGAGTRAYAGKHHGSAAAQASGAFVVATDCGVPCDGKTDAADAIERLIATHPNRTLFFPDGTYLVSRPIDTPAAPERCVSLVLGDYATIKAADNWPGGAVVRLGAADEAKVKGSLAMGRKHSLTGGSIDGSGVADGVSIDNGLQIKVVNTAIRNTQVGVHVKYGANSGSADCDISGVNIVGNNTPGSIGILSEAFDNSFSDMRISHIRTGVVLKKGGNTLRNIHPLLVAPYDKESCGFVISGSSNTLYYCYSDQMATAFKFTEHAWANLTDCYCFWYRTDEFETAIRCEGKFNAMVTGLRHGFRDDCAKRTLLSVAQEGGTGVLTKMHMPQGLSPEDASAAYIK